MSLDELALWAAWFAEYDPNVSTELRADMRAGVMAATIANCALFSKGGYEPDDFMPSLKTITKSQSEAEMEKGMIAWCANVGGEVKVKKKR